jgi:hypothetical protein
MSSQGETGMPQSAHPVAITNEFLFAGLQRESSDQQLLEMANALTVVSCTDRQRRLVGVMRTRIEQDVATVTAPEQMSQESKTAITVWQALKPETGISIPLNKGDIPNVELYRGNRQAISGILAIFNIALASESPTVVGAEEPDRQLYLARVQHLPGNRIPRDAGNLDRVMDGPPLYALMDSRELDGTAGDATHGIFLESRPEHAQSGMIVVTPEETGGLSLEPLTPNLEYAGGILVNFALQRDATSVSVDVPGTIDDRLKFEYRVSNDTSYDTIGTLVNLSPPVEEAPEFQEQLPTAAVVKHDIAEEQVGLLILDDEPVEPTTVRPRRGRRGREPQVITQGIIFADGLRSSS